MQERRPLDAQVKRRLRVYRVAISSAELALRRWRYRLGRAVEEVGEAAGRTQRSDRPERHDAPDRACRGVGSAAIARSLARIGKHVVQLREGRHVYSLSRRDEGKGSTERALRPHDDQVFEPE